MSRTTINYDTEERAIQIYTSIFIDDLELDLKSWGHDSLQLCTRYEKASAEQFVHEYLRENIKVKIDDVYVELSFLGKEQSDDLAAVWCYLEAYDVDSFDELTVTNTILTDQFPDQKNITMVQIDKQQIAHLLFTEDDTSEIIKR